MKTLDQWSPAELDREVVHLRALAGGLADDNRRLLDEKRDLIDRVEEAETKLAELRMLTMGEI